MKTRAELHAGDPALGGAYFGAAESRVQGLGFRV